MYGCNSDVCLYTYSIEIIGLTKLKSNLKIHLEIPLKIDNFIENYIVISLKICVLRHVIAKT